MLKTKIIEKYYPPKKTLELFSGIQFNIINGYARIIDKTYIKQVFPIVYKTNNLTIYEFINEEKKLEMDTLESEIVKEIFELYANGNNASQVARIMKENNRYLKIMVYGMKQK